MLLSFACLLAYKKQDHQRRLKGKEGEEDEESHASVQKGRC